MGLNHIYKVIWSKTKNAWVVVSEIAKRDGKSSVKSVVTSLAGKSVAAVMVAMVMCGGVASAATGTQYGTGATATYNDSVAVGENAQATNSGTTLVGANSQIQGQQSSVVGINNKDYGDYGISPYGNNILGSTNNVKGQNNIIVGNGSTISSGGNASSISSDATGNYNVAIGNNQSIGGDKNISILSDGYRLRGKQNISIGYGSHVGDSRNAEFALAIGAASAQGNNTVAIGRAALAENVHNSDTSIAIGTLSQATDSIAIGSNGTVGGIRSYLSARDSSVNIGYRNAIANNKSVILGTNNNYGFGGSTPVSTDGGVAIGHDNNISGAKNEVIIGSGNNTNGESQIAIGTNIQSNTHLGGVKGAVAIGYNSEFATLNKPSGTLNINGVNLDASNYAGNSSSLTYGNTFSIGKLNNERQLKNVAAGEISATSTDAINGSQLYEAVRAVTAGASPDVYMHVNDGTSTQGAGNATTNLGKANEKGGATGNVAVAIGKGATAQGNMAIAIGGSSSNANAGESIAMLGSVDASAEYGIAIGYSTRVQGSRGTVLGMGASSIGSGATALGSSSYAVGDGSVSLGYYNSAYAKNSVAIGPNTGTENGADNSVAIGYGASADYNATNAVAIGGARVGYSAMTGVGHISTTIDNSNSIAIGNGVQVFHKNTVAIGSYDNRTRTSFHTAGSTIPWQTDHNKLITPITATDMGMYGSVSTGFIEGTLGNSVYLGHESYAFTPNPLVDDESNLTGEQSIHTKKYDAAGNIVVSNNTTGGAFGKVSKATINGDEITGFAGAQSVGAVTIGAGDYERRIQNVAAGEVSATSTDAINGSQLYAVANTFSKNMSSYMHVNDGTSTQTVGNATTNYGYSGSKAGATGTKAIAGGMNAQASGDDAIAMGTWSSAAGEKAVAQGAHSTATDKGAVAIGGSYELSNAVKAENKGAVAIGSISTNIAGNDSLRGSVASGKNSIAILGSTGGENAVAMGTFASATANSSIAIGKKSLSSSAGSIAIGENTRVIDVNTGTINSGSMVAIGKGFSAIGNKSVVIGFNNGNDSASPMVAGNESVILGNQSSVWTNKITSGTMTSIDDIPKGSHIIGNRSMITESKDSVVVGNDSTITNADESIAIGKKASVEAANSIAIGSGAKASGEKSISIGTGNEVKGNKSSAIGDPSYIDTTATGTHVQGNDNGTATNPIKASESTFMGNTNLAGTAGTTGIHVVGNNNTVDSSNVMVMGNNVTVGTGLDGAVVLGHASSADQYAAATDSTINGVTFEAAGYAGNTGLNNGSIVSVGATGTERQIKNVAAGAVTATSTDAINGSQLYKTAETILKMPINMAGDSGDTVGLKLGKTVNIKGSVASGADVTDGNIAVVGDKATSTLSLKMAKNLTGLTSGTFTDATGNQTVINGAGVTVTPTGTGATQISITTSGINAGNQEIKGVKKGTTDDAAVNKKQMDDALAGISSTLTINDGTTDGSVNIKTGKLKVVGESGANALVTTTVSGDTISVGTSTKLQNAVTAAEKSADKDLSNLSTTGSDKVKTLAQDAVKVAGTGLATVSDATAAGVKTYTVNVDEGKLVIDDTTGKIGAAGATQGTVQGKDGVATTQDVASVVNSAIDKTKQALTDAKHDFAGDDATVISRKHGEQLNIKGGASTTASDLTSGNIAVVGDTTSGTLNIKMAKALTGLTSATYTDAAGNTQTVTGGSSTISDAAGNSTVVSKGGVTTTDGTNTTTVAPTGVTATDGTNTVKLTGSGIDAGNTQIKNVGKATTDDAAVNKKQMDDALKGATDNTVSLGSESGTTTAKKLSTTGGIKFNIKGETGANALITTSASGDDVTIAPTAKLSAAVTAAENSANKDLSNLSAAGDTYIKNLAKTAASWNVETNGAGTTAVAGGETVNFINGDNIAITNTGRSITIGTAKNVSFDKVTVGGIVLDKNTGINAGNKEIKGVANATSADAAVNKGQMDAAITAAAGGSLSTEKVVAKTLTGDTNLATVAGQTGTAKGETYEVAVSENAVKAVAATAAQDAVKVAGTGLATVSDATAAGVKTYTVNVDEGKLVIDDTTGKIGANGATQGTVQGKNGVATTQDVASVVNSAIDKTKQALTDAKHDFAGDDATVISRKHGEQLNIKGGASTTATDLTSGNIAVVGDTTTGTLNIKLAKALTGLTSATYTDAAGNTQTVTGGSSTITDGAGNTTTITKGGMTTTDGTNTTTVAPAGVTATDGTNTVKLNGSGIDAGNTQIKNVGKATTDDAAVNKKQMDDAVKAATDSISTLGDNKVSLGSDSGTTTAKKLSTTGGIKFNIKGDTGANALISTSATGDDVTIAPTAKLTAAVTAAEKSADKDLSNISPAGETVIKNLAATSAQDAVKVTGTGLATVSDSTTGGVKTYNVDVKTGNLVVTAAGQVGAAGTTGAGGAAGADGVATTQNVASAINDAITKSKTDTAQAIADAEHKFDGDTGTTSVRKHGEVLSVKGGVTATTDLTTGNIGVVSDGAGTLNIRLAKVLNGLTSASFTNTGGDSTVINGNGVTITPSATGASPISMTTAGINAGNKEIKGVANATSADAAVNKGQMDAAITAAAGGSLSTEKVVAKTLTGDNNLVTVTGQTGTAKGETYEVAVSENAVKSVAQTAAQDAVKVTGTGLANVTDSTTGGVKTYNVDVKTGNLVVTAAGQVGANGTTGAGGAAGANGVATTQNVASAINDAITKSKTDTAQAIADAEHKFDGDTGTTSVRKHGEVLSVKGGVTATTDLTTGNIGVVSDGAGTLNIRLAKVLSGLTSATYTDGAGNTQTVTGGSSTITDGAGNTTTITKGGMTTTDGTNTTTVAPSGVTATDGTNTVKLNGSGIDAGNTQIKNVGKATTDDAAVNKKQMDDAVKAATDSISTLGDNKVSLGSDSGTTTAKKLSTTGGIKFNIKGDTGANALITTSATGDDVTIAPTAKLSAAVTAAENSANKDLSNLSSAGNTYIQNLAKSAASWNVETNGAGTTAVAGGDTVNFINGDNIAITNTGRSITIGTAKNVSFDKVTVGGVVIDKNNGIDAGGKEITNVGPATSGNSAVNKTQMDTAITNAVNKATTDAKHDFGGDDTTVVTRKHGEKLNIKGGASTTAADLTSGNIAVLGDATTGTLNIRMAKALTGLSSATFTTPSGTTVINGGGMTITPSTTGAAPISITTGGINAGNTEIKNVAAGTTPNSAVNKQQMDSAISNATANVGFNTAGNTGTGSVSNGQTLSITGTNGIETNASGQSITVGLDAATRAQINNATTTANNAAKKDLSNIDNAGKQVIKNTAAWNVKVNGAAAETVKGGDTVTFNDGDNIKVTNTGKDITIATKKDVSFDKVTVGNVVIDKNTNRISGLANAANNDEAVNLGQMNAAISTATAGTGTIKYKANGGTQNSVALTTGFDFKGDSNIQITADPANSGVINYKLNPALTGITSISGGTGAPTITLNAGSGSTPGNVSINSNLDMGGKQINNIGAATHAGDAVNKAQMDQALQNIAGASSNAAKSYAYKAGAGAAALAALKPIQYDPLEPTQIMAGIGNYKSQTAVALGVAHYTNENTMFNLGVSLDSHDGIVNAGVTHKFGYSPEKKAIPDKYKGGPISSIYVMQDEVTALQAIVQKQAAENEALRQQNEDMQRKVDMILSKIH